MNKAKERIIKELVTGCKTGSRRAKKIKKGINQCDVTFESLHQMMEKQNWRCNRLHIPFLILDRRMKMDETNELGLNRWYLPSIDRIDNTKGYTMDNIQIVCMGYNNAKNRYDEKYLIQWLNSIISNNKEGI